jgi:outer membrane protein assembly factor BamB
LTIDTAAQDGRTFAAGAVHLNEAWSMKLGGPIVSSPVIEGGFAYVHSWDGNLYALDLASHQVAWKQFLGTQATWLGPAGVSSPPAFAADIGPHGAILVGAGGQQQASDNHLYFYALDAQTGDVLWRTVVGGARADSVFDSPLYLNGRVYIGTAGSGATATGDLPPRAGILFELDGQTGKILHKQSMGAPKGPGGAIWGSVSSNDDGTRVFVPTGDGSNAYVQHLVEGLVAVDPSTLKVLDHWQVAPNKQIGNDNDYGTAVTVFSDGSRALIGATIMSGTYYALDADHLKKGPVWKRQLGNSGSGNPYDDMCSSAFASGSAYPGVARSLSPLRMSKSRAKTPRAASMHSIPPTGT